MQTTQNVDRSSAKPGRNDDLVELQAAALEATANAVVITDQTGTVIWVNSAFEKLTGYPHAEIVGQSTRVLKSGLNPRVLYEDMWRTILGGRIWRGELTNRRKDGNLYDEEMTITPVHDSRGEITHYIAIKLDISERRQAEAKLLLLTERLSLATAVSKMGVWELDLASNTFIWDATMFEMYGFPPVVPLPYEKWSAAVCSEDLPAVEATLRKAIAEKAQGSAEFRIILADGTVRNVSAVGRAVLDEYAHVSRILGTAQDITERKTMEDKLRRLAAIVESSDDAIISKTLDGTIQSWNGGAERMYGYSAAEAIGKPISMLCPPGLLDQIPALLEKVRRGQIVEYLESVRARKDGKQVQIALTVSPIRDGTGRIVGASAIGRDITESKQMEEMFRQAQKMEAVGRLAGGVAHDFNNLLSVIIGYSEMLLERTDTDGRERQQCEEIKRAGDRAASLTRQLLAFSRQQVLEPRVLNLNTSVVEIEKMLRRLIGEDIELRTSLDPTLGSMKADPGQIEQVIMNLAVNARDAMPEGGKLVIETSNAELDDEYALHHPPCVAGRYVLLAVTDSGVGMSQETKAHIFEPFFTTKEVGKGTGLGLSTVFGVVKQSGGYIWVSSEPGQGSVFKIYLPRVDESERQIQPTQLAPELLRGTETVLLVEDEQSVRALTRNMLEQSGYTVLEADSGARAMEIAQQHHDPIHLLLSDVVMPGMNGPTLVRKILPLHPEAKELYVSGYSGKFGTQTGLIPAGATLLQKPFSRTALLLKLRNLLDVQKKSDTTF
jgi:two-component system, cell cycle sensor histidine kinase and response regulator CckA